MRKFPWVAEFDMAEFDMPSDKTEQNELIERLYEHYRYVTITSVTQNGIKDTKIMCSESYLPANIVKKEKL